MSYKQLMEFSGELMKNRTILRMNTLTSFPFTALAIAAALYLGYRLATSIERRKARIALDAAANQLRNAIVDLQQMAIIREGLLGIQAAKREAELLEREASSVRIATEDGFRDGLKVGRAEALQALKKIDPRPTPVCTFLSVPSPQCVGRN